MAHQQSDDDDLAMRSDSPSTPSTPTNPSGPLRTSTAELQQIDLQSPPHSQETTPYLERSTSSLLTSDPQGGYRHYYGSSNQGVQQQQMGVFNEAHSHSESMFPGADKRRGSGKGKEESKPSWLTKRGIEEAVQQSEKLLDQGFSTSKYASIFDESDMKT